MRNYKALLATFIEVVTFLLASFGGFLKRIAPPSQVGASFPVGILSFLMLIILMIISATARRSSGTNVGRNWLIAGSFLGLLSVPSVFIYAHLVNDLTFPQNREVNLRKVNASEKYLTPDAKAYVQANPSKEIAPDDLIRNLPDDDVWTRPGIDRASGLLLASYSSLVLLLAAAIFCLLEANLRTN
jgi:hypothetical protein